jgi:hypothetical protein
MTKIKMIATARFTYAGVNLRAGEAFDASSKDARVLRAIKKADVAPAPAPPAIVRAKPLPKQVEPVAVELDTDAQHIAELQQALMGASHRIVDLERKTVFLEERIEPGIVAATKGEPTEPAVKRSYKRKDMVSE